MVTLKQTFGLFTGNNYWAKPNHGCCCFYVVKTKKHNNYCPKGNHELYKSYRNLIKYL